MTAAAVRDVGQLLAGATKASQRLATFAIDGEIRFASAADRAAFAEELAASVTSLVASTTTRRLRVVVTTAWSSPSTRASRQTSRRLTERGPEMAHPFELTDEIEVDATPEEVWNAIATGPGVDAWFMGRSTRSSRGRAARPACSSADPRTSRRSPRGSRPYTSRSRTAEAEDGALHAFEYIVEGRDKGSTVVRWVHSGFLGDNWEKEYEGLTEGDPMYFDKLRVYLTYFRGRTATPVERLRRTGGPGPRRGMGDLPRGARPRGAPSSSATASGSRRTGSRRSNGVVDYLSRDFLGVRTDDGLYRFMHISVFGGPVGLGHHIFVDGLDQAETEQAWESWLTKLFA